MEHLKRHERSHTKEKPFECPQCTRCFARRDLLLRHQQKLHQTGTTSSRPRSGRRGSTAGTTGNGQGRVRKNSIAGSVSGNGASNGAGMRPRANTISHIDGAALSGFLASSSTGNARSGMTPGHSHHSSLNGFSGPGGYDYRGMSTILGGQALPKLDTQLGMGMGGGMRTAPIGTFNDQFDLEKFFGNQSTINPAQLHFGGSLGSPNSPFPNFSALNDGMMDEDDSIDWTTSLDHSVMFNSINEHALDESSPSAVSSASQSGFSEVMLDGSNNPATTNASMWHNPSISSTAMSSAQFNIDPLAPVFASELMNPLSTISPKDLQDQSMTQDFFLSSPGSLGPISPTAGIPGIPNQFFNPHLSLQSDNASASPSSMNGSARQSSVTSFSSDSITEATRQALLLTLSQALGYGSNQRKYSQPSVSSPLSANGSNKAQGAGASLPSTAQLQKFVNAYITYFHPHLPFLHIPTLSFDSPTYQSYMRSAPNHAFGQDGIVGGGGCLILAMAAIGALFEFEPIVGKELFEAAKRIIMYYLEERRRAGLSAASSGPMQDMSMHQTPLWLVQAMLLNLVFGHNCGDKQAIEVATTHCAALVSLAKAADLDKPQHDSAPPGEGGANSFKAGDMDMLDIGSPNDVLRRNSRQDSLDEHSLWLRWKAQEERKRTYYSIFILSCILVTAYAHPPKILNSEIRLDLPCEEALWSADSAQAWAALGGAAEAQRSSLAFSSALTYLLDANLRLAKYGEEVLKKSDIRPSTFGCYILINALHVYIWETRQRHSPRQWKAQEMDSMHAQVEPALIAWQAAWQTNPMHSVARPNPFGPLSADSIPYLDLAYVRLFVDLGRIKDAFWQRDFDVMAEELARGVEIVQISDGGDESSDSSDTGKAGSAAATTTTDGATAKEPDARDASSRAATDAVQSSQSSKRERHLRRAAFYAADSLAMADKLGVTFAEFSSRELAIGSAVCTFDCAQVLAEWVATIQERVGRYLGVLGRDNIDLSAVPAIMLLEEEDIKLLGKVCDIVTNAEMKISFDMSGLPDSDPPTGIPELNNMSQHGYGSKLLLATAFMLEKAKVWPSKYLSKHRRRYNTCANGM